jgi:hypothetical protein
MLCSDSTNNVNNVANAFEADAAAYNWGDWCPEKEAIALEREALYGKYFSPIEVTFFRNQYARKQWRERVSLYDLQRLIQATTKSAKGKLPWLKFATFGDKPTKANCLRHNANVLSITGIELDYDAKEMTLDAAIAIAKGAQLLALFYTSASYTEAAPKWRILLPTSKPLPPGERAKLVARVNGVYGGIFAPESFNLSTSYYFGAVNNNPVHRAVLVGGDYINRRDDLDEGAQNKKKKEASNGGLNVFEQHAEDQKAERIAAAKANPTHRNSIMQR